MRHNLIGPQLRRLRYQRGLSQSQLAVELAVEGLEVSRDFIATIEGQHHFVRDRDLLYLAHVLRIGVTDLFPRLNSSEPFDQTMARLLGNSSHGRVFQIVTPAAHPAIASDGKCELTI